LRRYGIFKSQIRMASTAPAASITSLPARDQVVEHGEKRYTTVQEGLAYILVPESAQGKGQTVFYNPIQQYNRDLTVLAIKVFGEDWIATRKRKPAKWHQKKVADMENRGTKRIRQPDASEDSTSIKRTKTSTEDATQDATMKDEFEDDDISDELLLAAAKDAELEKRGPPFRILDALSATGLRALRYVHEIPFATSITANDLSPDAVESIKRNIEHNALPNPAKVRVTTGNAVTHMYSQVGKGHSNDPKYSVIDLDPYGTAVPFLDASIQALADDGLLCVTCTDSAIFNSMGYVEKTFSQYGGLPVKAEYYHEVGLRLILNSIATTAAKYGIAMEPLLSLSIDYYARVFVRLKKSPADVKLQANKQMALFLCDYGCGSWSAQHFVRCQPFLNRKGDTNFKFSSAQAPTADSLCEHCGFKKHIAGPMWGGPLHNPAFVQKILDNIPSADSKIYASKDQITGMLKTALDETSLYQYPEGSITESIAKDITQETKANSRLEEKSTAVFARLSPLVTDPHPFFVTAASLSRIVRCQSPSDAQLKGALRHMGYRAVRSHTTPGSIKTDAPWPVLWDIMRAWIKKSGITPKSLTPTTAGYSILYGIKKKQPEIKEEEWEEMSTEQVEVRVDYREGVGWRVLKKKKANSNGSNGPIDTIKPEEQKQEIIFDETLGKKEASGKFARYKVNPQNWGPMSKAKASEI
jgi:tRNA (guanine26-N2/guanine27-N2)-dimethyltransferase